jgi:hypothetical protein
LRVEKVFEGRQSEPAIGCQKALGPIYAQLQIPQQQALNCRDNLIGAETRAGTGANFSVSTRIAAKSDLIVFNTGFLEAQNPDVPNMVMAASIDAA